MSSMRPMKSMASDVFEDWVSDNEVMAPWRSRFDDMREGIRCLRRNKRLSRDTFIELLTDEGYGDRYPLIPKSLK